MTKSYDILITIFGLFFGQLYIRITSLKGSFDKPWLLLPFFLVPPLSIVPAVYVYFDWINPGADDPIIDYSVYSVIATYIIVPLIINKVAPTEYKTIITIILFYLIIFSILYYRDYNTCNKNKNNNDKKDIILPDLMKTSAFNTGLITTGAILVPQVLKLVPFVGTGVTIAENLIPMGSDMLNMIGASLMIIILHMYENSFKDAYCNTTPETYRIIVIMIISIMLNIFSGTIVKT